MAGIGALFLAGVVIVVTIRWLVDVRSARHDDEPEIDYDELDAAEREVRELDADVDPDDADEQLRDWGPGAPR